jgi:hypothetical protein
MPSSLECFCFSEIHIGFDVSLAKLHHSLFASIFVISLIEEFSNEIGMKSLTMVGL